MPAAAPWPAAPPPPEAPARRRGWQGGRSEVDRKRLDERQPELLIEALAQGALAPEENDLQRLAARVDARQAVRLLALARAGDVDPSLWPALLAALGRTPTLEDEVWREPLIQLATAEPELPLLPVLGRFRHPDCAALLRRALARPQGLEPTERALLLPLLGYQRCPDDFALLRDAVTRPDPLALRRAALEGVARGLSAWPLEPLQALLEPLAADLDPILASLAVDLIARLPGGAGLLRRLAGRPIEPGVARRLERRLRSLGPSPTPLLLLVHGRSGGEIPPELRELAAELETRRGAPVRLQALTGEAPAWGAALEPRPGVALTLVPLLLLPGGHVRHDLPAIAARWQGRLGPGRPLRRLPFLGAWPAWQAVLAELAATAAAGPARPVIWGHHPLEGPLAQRYLRHLERVSGARCQPVDTGVVAAAPYTQSSAAVESVVLPLALASSRLTERLGPPLLHHPRPRQVLLDQLVALP